MSRDITKLDPTWAWTLYAPDADHPWTTREAAHLLRRATFGTSWQDIKQAAKSSPAELVRELVYERTDSAEKLESFEKLSQYIVATGKPENLPVWWLRRLAESRDQLREKLTLFWHGHFATSAEKVQDLRLMLAQNDLFREHALGRFPEMVQQVSKDPAMLIYLDSVTNRKSHPNENYAREVMELFCLGEGNYTEEDVLELARCFTGWEVRNEQFKFNRYQHDNGEKTILGQTGKFGGEEGVEIILEQDECPRFLVRKLVKFFLFDEPDVPDALIEPLAVEFKASGYEIAPLMERILGSNLCFSEFSYARKIRSPVEFALGLLRGLESQTDSFLLSRELAFLGQSLFYPPNVKGWDGGRAWINSSTLLARANLVRRLVDARKDRFAEGELSELLAGYDCQQPEEIVDWLLGLFVAVPVPSNARERLIELAKQNKSQPGEVVHALCTLPEFQLA